MQFGGGERFENRTEEEESHTYGFHERVHPTTDLGHDIETSFSLFPFPFSNADAEMVGVLLTVETLLLVIVLIVLESALIARLCFTFIKL
jgi:hypothetical protein